MSTTPWFATREDIRSALDAESAARSDAQLDRALDAASRAVVGLCHRDFVPVLATRFFDWPSEQTPRSWRVWLDQNDLISVSGIVSGDTTIPTGDVYLEPANSGPPYNRVETRLDGPSAWQAGDTHQRAIAITGLWGYRDDQTPAGALATGIDASTTAATVTDSAAVGVGHILTVGAERMTVTGKRLADTGQTIQTPLDAKPASQQVDVADGTGFHEGETLTIGAERVLVRDIAGDTLIVKRAVDGTVLDSHSGDPIWAPRLLTVRRGDYGTTAATATGGALVTRWLPPGLVHQLAVAEAQSWLLNEQAGYLRTTGTAQSAGTEATMKALTDLRDQCYTAHGRHARMRAV